MADADKRQAATKMGPPLGPSMHIWILGQALLTVAT